MALRQREWSILIRPYYVDSRKNVTYYDKVPKAAKVADFGDGQTPDTPVALKGNAEGMEIGSTLPIDEGGWVVWYVTTSFPKLREKYKECLNTVPKQYIRVMEMIPVDTMVTPIS